MKLKDIKVWQALGALVFVGVAIALFLYVRGSGPEPTETFADPGRQALYDSGMVTCMAAARENPAIIEAGAPEAAMQAYCDCGMSALAKVLTTEEIMFTYEHNDFPDSAYAKMEAIAATCWQTYLPN